MKRILILVFVLFLCACGETNYKENEAITKYVVDKYGAELKKENVKFLKCWPKKDGTMHVTYTTVQRDNAFPATIRFDYLNRSFDVYFDIAYLNGPKSDLLNDIDMCMECWTKIKDSKKTW